MGQRRVRDGHDEDEDGHESVGRVETVLQGQVSGVARSGPRWTVDGRARTPAAHGHHAGDVPEQGARWERHMEWYGAMSPLDARPFVAQHIKACNPGPAHSGLLL